MLRFIVHALGILVSIGAGLGLLARFIPPDALWPPAIVALVLPALLALTLGYLAYTLLSRRWAKAVFPGLILLCSLPLLPQLFSFGGSTAGEGSTVTVLTSNARGFRDDAYQWVAHERVGRYLREVAPDVLLVQECYRSGHAESGAEVIKAASGLGKRHQPDRGPLATFADDLQFVSDQYSRNGLNGLLVSDVKTDIGTVRVINAHLQSNQISDMATELGQGESLEENVDRTGSMLMNYGQAAARRARQAEELRRIVRESPHPVIVGGDFNDVPSSYTYRRSLSPRLRDAWVEAGFGMGTTFSGPLPGLRIDYLMVDTALQIHSIRKVETGFSDHYALEAILSR